MKRNGKKAPGFDEIIFENRNREYGAYDLRKRYKSAASFSILACVSLCALIFILISAFKPKDANPGDGGPIIVVLNTTSTTDPNKLIKPDVPKPVKVPDINRYVAPRVSTDTFDLDKIMTTDLALDEVVNGVVTDKKDTVTYVQTIKDPDVEEIFIKVEEDAIFPGGPKALLKYIADNTIYPEEAVENNIQGRVIVKFAVWSDGTVRKIEVMRGVNPILDAEAVRVVSTLPQWKPGRQNGKPVPVWFFVPVTFQMITR